MAGRSALSVLVSLLAGLGGCNQLDGGETEFVSRASSPIPSSAADRESAPSALPAEMVGVVVPVAYATVTARIDGIVERLDVSVGSRVEEGAVVARLDGLTLGDDVRIARAKRAAAIAKLDERKDARVDARTTLAKDAALGPDLVTGDALQHSQARARAAAASVRIADAQVATADAELAVMNRRRGDLSVLATATGRVQDVEVEPGESVVAGEPLFRIADDSSARVRFAVSTDARARLAEGGRVCVLADDSTRGVDAIVDRIAPSLDVRAGVFAAEARWAARTEGHVIGSAVRVRFGRCEA